MNGNNRNLRSCDVIAEIKDSHTKDEIIRLCDHAFPEPIALRANYDELLKKIHENGVFFAAYDVDPVGYAAMYANDENAKTAYVTLFAVRPEYQGLHIGKRLIDACVRKARECNMSFVKLEVKKENQRAIRFYQKCGFDQQGSETEKSIFMIKPL